MRTSRVILSGTLALTLAAGFAANAQAVAPGSVATTEIVNATATLPGSASMATLPTGAVAVGYVRGSDLVVQTRGPGEATFRPELVRVVSSPIALGGIPAAFAAPTVTVLPLSTSSFLVGWSECVSGGCSLLVAEVPWNAASMPVPTAVSGSDVALPSLVRFATATDGSIAAMWAVTGLSGNDLRITKRDGLAGSWSTPETAGTSTLSYLFDVAIDTAHTVTAAWAMPGAAYEVRVRARRASGWGTQIVATSVHSAAFSGTSPLFDLKAAGTSTVLAALDDMTGTTTYSDTTPVGVTLLTRESTDDSMHVVKRGLSGPGRYAVQPNVAIASDGSAVLRFADIAYTAPATSSPENQVSTHVVQRRGATGAWSAPMLIDAAADTNGLSNYTPTLYGAMLLSDGTYVTAGYSAVRVGSSALGRAAALQTRSGWTSPVAEPITTTEAYGLGTSAAVVNVTGRTTLMWMDNASRLIVTTTVLAKPAPLARASLSTATPRRGSALTCRVTWAEATSVGYRWLRNGAPIAGATARNYTPSRSDVGQALSCRSTASNAKGAVTTVAVARTVRAA